MLMSNCIVPRATVLEFSVFNGLLVFRSAFHIAVPVERTDAIPTGIVPPNRSTLSIVVIAHSDLFFALLRRPIFGATMLLNELVIQ